MRKLLALALSLVCLALSASAGEDPFSWRQCAGQNLRVILNQHPYSEGLIRRIHVFEEITGIDVAFAMYPDKQYYDRLDDAFNSEFGKPDVFMTGAYQVWAYAPKGRMLPLDPYMNNPSKTRQNYNPGDFYPNIIGAFRWNGKPGVKPGEGPLWAIPMGFESCALTYNREILARFRIPPPQSLEAMIEAGKTVMHFDGPGTYGIGVRGAGQWWNVIPSGFTAAFINYGARDLAIENHRLVSKVNSPEAVKATELWMQLLQNCGPADWEDYDWSRCLDDIGNRKAAMLYDADVLGFFANSSGASPQSGRLATALPPVPKGANPALAKTNLRAWGLAVNPESANLDASWLFVQYFTNREFQLYSVVEWKSVNPPRKSVFDDPEFQRVARSMPGYVETFTTLLDNMGVYYTPNPHFFEIVYRWSDTLQDIVKGKYESPREGLDALKKWMDEKLAEVEVE